MAATQIAAGSPLARKIYGAALFARVIQAPAFTRALIGEAPQQGDAEAKLKGQTASTMPIVRVTDLAKTQGDKVSVDLFDTILGQPIVGDRQAEGRGEKLVSSSMDVRIDLLTKVVDAGGKMTAQRTIHNLRGIAMAQLEGYFPRLYDQLSIVHMAGARGSMTGRDWIVPLQFASTSGTTLNPDFTDIAVNTVMAPTYNRHFVVNNASKAGTLVQGGQQLGSIASTDLMTLEAIDSLSLALDDLPYPLPNVKVADDPAANDEPIKGVLWVTPRQWYNIQTEAGSSNTWRTFLQNAWHRKSYGTKHPLFSGEPGLWNGILVRKLPRFTIRFQPGEYCNYVSQANQYSAVESAVQVNSGLASNFAVERAILTGGQALAMVYGRNNSSGFYFSWNERLYNFERATEIAGDAMFGMSKLRFNFTDPVTGNLQPTDYGAIVVDTAVQIS
jgi:N4-gp56 family major capsid protein